MADGLYGYRPSAPFDRVVAICSVRTVPAAWIAQTRRVGRILAPLGGWLGGYARALLTVHGDGTASGPLLPGTVSFMLARAHQPPQPGNPLHRASLEGGERAARLGPGWLTEATDEAFHLRFLAQWAVPDAQAVVTGEATHLIDVVSGSVATLTPRGDGWRVRQAGPVRLWDLVEEALGAHAAAGSPSPASFELQVDADGAHWLRHPKVGELRLPGTG